MTTISDKIQSLTDLEVCTGTAGGTVIPAIIISPTANAAAANILTLTNASMGQATTLTIQDPGAATASVVTAASSAAAATFSGITAGTAAASKAVVLGASKDIATITSATITTMTGNVVGNITGNVTGGIIGKPSAAQSTISAVAGAANTATITVQLKDIAGTNLTSVTPFQVYSSSAADGLTLQSAASTGYSVASGGLSRANGTAVTTAISAVSSATGGCVLSLLDTGKLTSYLVLVVGESIKISTQLSAGSYG